MDAREINTGECGNFAEAVYEDLMKMGIETLLLDDAHFYDCFGDEEDLCDPREFGSEPPPDFQEKGLGAHRWIYYNGKHYDSESPEGVENLFDLNTFKLSKGDTFKYTRKLRESLTGKSKEQFFMENNIDPEDLWYMGNGDFGTAYSIGDGRVLKVTRSESEFEIAQELIGKTGYQFEGFADFYVAEIVEDEMMIIMEELEEDSDIEDLWYQLDNLLSQEGIPVQYLGHLDLDEYDIDEELQEFINDVEDINWGYRALGIEASDIRPENMGRDKNGKVKAFDIEDRRRT